MSQYRSDIWGNPCALDELLEAINTIMVPGDKVQQDEGWRYAGRVGTYLGIDPYEADMVWVEWDDPDGQSYETTVLAESIVPLVKTREERIEEAIEDFENILGVILHVNDRAALFAVLDAGV